MAIVNYSVVNIIVCSCIDSLKRSVAVTSLSLFLFCTKERRICYRIVSKRINHIGKIVMTILRKLQFCNGHVKSSKSDSFLKCAESLLTVVIQISAVKKAIFVYRNVSEFMTVYLSNLSAPEKASRNTHSRRII